ncbi:MAG: epsE [Acidobacteria bacterium]|nr:epsE [Acidobacteriota bacterium]
MRVNHAGRLTLFALAAALIDPSVSAAVERQPPDAVAYRVLVTGEVRYPGRATLTESTMSVADALAAVGSPTANAGDEVVVIRPMRPGGLPERVVIALKDVDEGTAGIDVSLRDGDVVNVPAAARFFISGFAKRPGAYKLRRGTTVSQALALAGGVSSNGNERRVRISRIVNGKSIEIGAQPDDTVMPNDEIKIQRKMF